MPEILLEDYYVYVWSFPNGTPFYVGMGREDRIFHVRRNYIVQGLVKSIAYGNGKVIQTKVRENLSQQQAFQLEVELITRFGRMNNGTGILANLTGGGVSIPRKRKRNVKRSVRRKSNS